MIGNITIYQRKKAKGTNVYIFKLDKKCLEILNTDKIEVKFNNENEIILFKPSLNTCLVYKIHPDDTIRVSTNNAYIDLTGEYYIHSEEDDSLGFELIKI